MANRSDKKIRSVEYSPENIGERVGHPGLENTTSIGNPAPRQRASQCVSNGRFSVLRDGEMIFVCTRHGRRVFLYSCY